MTHVDSASDARTANNAVRHQYRVLSDLEKAQMLEIKDLGAALITAIDRATAAKSPCNPRDAEIAVQRAEEAVMWAVKFITR